jgi:hypothetical protein
VSYVKSLLAAIALRLLGVPFSIAAIVGMTFSYMLVTDHDLMLVYKWGFGGLLSIAGALCVRIYCLHMNTLANLEVDGKERYKKLNQAIEDQSEHFNQVLTDQSKQLNEAMINTAYAIASELEADRLINNQRHENHILAYIQQVRWADSTNLGNKEWLDIETLFRNAPGEAKASLRERIALLMKRVEKI